MFPGVTNVGGVLKSTCVNQYCVTDYPITRFAVGAIPEYDILNKKDTTIHTAKSRSGFYKNFRPYSK